MRTADIRNKLRSTLFDLGPVVEAAWSNVDRKDFAKPYFDTSFTGIDQQDDSLKGGDLRTETGQFSVVVVIEKGKGEDQALDLADDVALLFPKGTRLSIADGTVEIVAAPKIRNGFPTDADYRIPVAISYRAERSIA